MLQEVRSQPKTLMFVEFHSPILKTFFWFTFLVVVPSLFGNDSLPLERWVSTVNEGFYNWTIISWQKGTVRQSWIFVLLYYFLADPFKSIFDQTKKLILVKYIHLERIVKGIFLKWHKICKQLRQLLINSVASHLPVNGNNICQSFFRSYPWV